ncbi:MAG TPA: hypothetical protein VGL11_22055 [Candidatus Binatia bacterium]
MSTFRVIIVVLVVAVVATAGPTAPAGQSVWDGAFDAAKQERFIPVELWTGSEWDGARELKMTSADTRFGDRAQKNIKGPTEWKHPVTGETLLVYERTNQEKTGLKVELFAINEAKNGLGRVYDSRTAFGTRTFSGGLKFPLGYWKQGETRQLTEKRYEGRKAETRTESITIKQLDFTHQGAPHCLEFYWVYRDGGKIVDHQTYTYCPNQAMVRQVQH